MPTGTIPRLLPFQFAALALAWGSSFLFMRIGLDGLSPIQVVVVRMTLGSATLLALCLALRVRLPREPRTWAHISVVSVFLCVIPFSLFAWATQYIPSGLASIYNATTPLMTLLITLAALRSERPHRFQLLGIGVGLTGLMTVLAPWQLENSLNSPSLVAQLACLLATASYGVAFVYLRKFVSPLGVDAVSVAAIQVTIGAALLLFAAPFMNWGGVTLSPSVVASMMALGIFGTGLAYIWNTNIVAGWGATVASSVTYLSPVIGVALGAVILGERVAWNHPVGAAVVIAGIILSRRNPAGRCA
ncbi:DMT family transporter [Nesterenkonia muleiensis]|uniref:DMT family transporter n=1 Tax=Nesterenkonia muleiensis TaxID=2282648 RepID=UPI001EE47509|nr:DMT family transporter [Nesterenkonia muleiensis]